MSYGEVEHFAIMVSGCESINMGDVQPSDAKYALGVLKLHAQDMGLVAGQEGFLDAVKKGAQSIKEWFLSLLKAIGNFIKEITGHNKKRRAQEAELARKEKEVADDKERAERYERKLAETFTAVFKEPLRLSEQVYEDIKSSDHLDRDVFKNLNVSNMRIHGGTNAIQTLIFEAKEIDHQSPKTIAKELETLKLAIDELSYDASREVSKWVEEDVKAEQRKDISSAAYILKKFTQVLGWYEDGLTRYYTAAEKIKP